MDGAGSDTCDAGAAPIADEEVLDRGDLALESLMLGLRTVEGVDLDRFSQRFGVDLAKNNAELIQTCAREGLLRYEDGHLRPTAAGLAVVDGLCARLDLSPSQSETGKAG